MYRALWVHQPHRGVSDGAAPQRPSDDGVCIAASPAIQVGYRSLAGLEEVLRRILPALSHDGAVEAMHTLILLTGAMWTYAHPLRTRPPLHEGSITVGSSP